MDLDVSLDTKRGLSGAYTGVFDRNAATGIYQQIKRGANAEKRNDPLRIVS